MSTYFIHIARHPSKSALKSKWQISLMFQSRIVKRIGSSIGAGLYTHIIIPASFTFRDASISAKLLKTSSAGPSHVNFIDFDPSLNFSAELDTVAFPFAEMNDGTPSSKVYCALIAA